jgi:hypothetical protein
MNALQKNRSLLKVVGGEFALAFFLRRFTAWKNAVLIKKSSANFR